jgi:hypothetical protein
MARAKSVQARLSRRFAASLLWLAGGGSLPGFGAGQDDGALVVQVTEVMAAAGTVTYQVDP